MLCKQTFYLAGVWSVYPGLDRKTEVQTRFESTDRNNLRVLLNYLVIDSAVMKDILHELFIPSSTFILLARRYS